MTSPPRQTMAERTRDLSTILTQWPSVSATAGEAAFGPKLRDLLAETPYFASRPDQVFTLPSHGEPLRENVVALVRGSGRRTLVLAGHYDTVSIANYGTLAAAAHERHDAFAQRLAVARQRKHLVRVAGEIGRFG